jgi:hypothetical protein
MNTSYKMFPLAAVSSLTGGHVRQAAGPAIRPLAGDWRALRSFSR